jgi:ketosteroid isomerase-like protein
MESTVNSPEAVAHAFLRAINRQDVDALASLMPSGHRFIDSLGNVVVGQERARQGWAYYFSMVPDYTLAIEETYLGGPVVVMLGVAQGTYASDGQIHPENHWQTPVALRAQVEEGLVAEWRVYADNEPIRQIMAKSQKTA